MTQASPTRLLKAHHFFGVGLWDIQRAPTAIGFRAWGPQYEMISWGCIGIMENKLETTILYRDYVWDTGYHIWKSSFRFFS